MLSIQYIFYIALLVLSVMVQAFEQPVCQPNDYNRNHWQLKDYRPSVIFFGEYLRTHTTLRIFSIFHHAYFLRQCIIDQQAIAQRVADARNHFNHFDSLQ